MTTNPTPQGDLPDLSMSMFASRADYDDALKLHPAAASKAVQTLLSLGYLYRWDDAGHRAWVIPTDTNATYPKHPTQPTYYVQHPDGSYSMAEPQPCIAASQAVQAPAEPVALAFPHSKDFSETKCPHCEAQFYIERETPLECTRSHPHENMDAMCELRTVIARLENEKARATPPGEVRQALTDEQSLEADALKFGTTVEYQRERRQWEKDVSAMAHPRIKRTTHG